MERAGSSHLKTLPSGVLIAAISHAGMVLVRFKRGILPQIRCCRTRFPCSQRSSHEAARRPRAFRYCNVSSALGTNGRPIWSVRLIGRRILPPRTVRTWFARWMRGVARRVCHLRIFARSWRRWASRRLGLWRRCGSGWRRRGKRIVLGRIVRRVQIPLRHHCRVLRRRHRSIPNVPHPPILPPNRGRRGR